MTNIGAILSSIISTNDPQYLLSFVTDDLFVNYKSYTKESISASSFDYTTLSTKIAYDAFTNTSTTTISGNIKSETNRTKSTITYAKQYILRDNNTKEYSYRIISEESPIVVTANATSTSSPSIFTSNIQTIEQTFTLNVLKTTAIQSFVANSRDDFLLMPSIFASPNIMYNSNPTDNYYALRVMLLNYYGSNVSTAVSTVGSVLIGLSFVVGLGALMLGFKWNSFVIFISTTLLPIVLVFIFSHQNTSNLLIEKINSQSLVNQYLILSGTAGSLIGVISFLYKIYKYPYIEVQSFINDN